MAEAVRRTQKAESFRKDKEVQKAALESMKKKNDALCNFIQDYQSRGLDKTMGRVQVAFDDAVEILKSSGESEKLEQEKQLLRDFREKMRSNEENDKKIVRQIGTALEFKEKDAYGKYLLKHLRNDSWL